ncbi:PEP-CTERM sorting domain-containing protein [Cerasicoccus arenae]|uniref:PEP-CTERM protein-sorting domain-containing protein n=1 Tax=Cerasicoccus arenae TaxID=424488 RepID=A0A8J3GFR3_9BACT|nr:PEP-CTERM sorting domain-containing protein [Cerasicoccus arenae]MBK1857412.1 PEP-CTERM sorting domain-containing protein [Cerasicoccus arenae]GHC07876.1 hypothetical protein GCM10007047_26360 [Cerasicoccus arenae]
MNFPTLATIALSLGMISSATATVIVFDDFGSAAGSSDLPGRTPVVTPGNNWTGYTSGSNVGWKVIDGDAVFGTSSTVNGMAGIELGSDYFVNNPAIYSLKSTISMTPDGGSDLWYGIGYSNFISTGQNRGFYAVGEANEGKPWMFMRQNGELNVRVAGATTVYSDTGYDVSNFEIELVLDTSVANWTVDAYINGAQLDLNGVSIGMSYTYVNNPTLAAIGLSAPDGVVGSVESITLQTIPEPHTYALILGAACLIGLIARRRR